MKMMWLNSYLRIMQRRPVSSFEHASEIAKNNPIDIYLGIKNNPWGKK
jgi:hypothetical protein